MHAYVQTDERIFCRFFGHVYSLLTTIPPSSAHLISKILILDISETFLSLGSKAEGREREPSPYFVCSRIVYKFMLGFFDTTIY